MNKKHLTWLIFVLAAAVLIGGSFLAGRHNATAQAVQAQELLKPDAPEEVDATHGCAVDNVAVFETRIHLHCSSPATGGISYFAYATDSAHAANANRFLVIANSAYALGDHVVVFYSTDAALNPPGCNTGDCRSFSGLSMVP